MEKSAKIYPNSKKFYNWSWIKGIAFYYDNQVAFYNGQHCTRQITVCFLCFKFVTIQHFIKIID